jgi:hypothetical protein
LKFPSRQQDEGKRYQNDYRANEGRKIGIDVFDSDFRENCRQRGKDG